jgi:uncharacterized membrane protein
MQCRDRSLTDARARRHGARVRALRPGQPAGLIVLGLAWELWLAPTGSGTLA